MIQKTNSGMFQVGQDNVVKEFPKLDECGWAKDELDLDTIDIEPYTRDDVERGEVMYLVECGHVFRTSQFLLSFPDPLTRVIPYDTTWDDHEYHFTAAGPPACPVCRRLIPDCHVRLLPREAFRKQFYSEYYSSLPANVKADMQAEWDKNHRALAPYGLQTSISQSNSISFPPNIAQYRNTSNKQHIDDGEIQFFPLASYSGTAMARRSAATPAIAAAGAVLGLFITYKLYSRARHI